MKEVGILQARKIIVRKMPTTAIRLNNEILITIHRR